MGKALISESPEDKETERRKRSRRCHSPGSPGLPVYSHENALFKVRLHRLSSKYQASRGNTQIPRRFFRSSVSTPLIKNASLQMISAGTKFIDLVQKLLRFIYFCEKTVACGNIRDGTAKMIFHRHNGHQIIIFGFIQRSCIQSGPRSYHTDHFSFYQSLCFFSGSSTCSQMATL